MFISIDLCIWDPSWHYKSVSLSCKTEELRKQNVYQTILIDEFIAKFFNYQYNTKLVSWFFLSTWFFHIPAQVPQILYSNHNGTIKYHVRKRLTTYYLKHHYDTLKRVETEWVFSSETFENRGLTMALWQEYSVEWLWSYSKRSHYKGSRQCNLHYSSATNSQS